MLVATRPHLFTAFTPVLPRKSHLKLKEEISKKAADAQPKSTDGYQKVPTAPNNELVGNNPEKRNWKGMLIAVLVIMMVCGCVVLAVVLLSEDEKDVQLAKVSLSDVIDETWKETVLSKAQWVGGSLVWQDSYGNVMRMIYPNVDSTLVIRNTTMENLEIFDYSISSDFRFALLAYNKKQVNSYSYNASYIVYNIEDRTRRSLLKDDSIDVFQYAGFGSIGNQLIYIVEGNIYYRENIEAEETNITNDHFNSFIRNGIANWQYEELILKSSIAHWFSPDGTYLAYARFDDRDVPEAFVTSYSTDTPLEQTPHLYPQIESYRYSKAGQKNTEVNVQVVNLKTGRKITLSRPVLIRKRLEVLHAVSWSLDSNTLLITWSNRTQSVSVTQQCSPELSSCVDDILHTKAITTNGGGWVPYMNQPYLWSDESGIFFYILSRRQGGKSSFMHLAMVNYTQKPPLKNFLTDGPWEVTKLLHYCSTTKSVYYISNELHLSSRHVFRVDISQRKRSCLTCQNKVQSSQIFYSFKKTDTVSCMYYDAEFGRTSNWFLLHCLGPGIPYSTVALINFNEKEKDSFTNTKTSSERNPKFFSFPLHPSLSLNYSRALMRMYTYGSIAVNGRSVAFKMLQPMEGHVSLVPVIFMIGDIGSQDVDFRFRMDFPEYFASINKAITIFLDGSGSGYRGNSVLQSIAGQPGELEVEDMMAIIRHLKDALDIVPARIGVMGKGYGGYVSILALSKPQVGIGCGIAVSPIVDWSWYSSFESEKVLGNPLTNPLGYERSSLLKRVDSLRGKNLLVFQGMKDRLVHQQHTVLLKQTSVNIGLPLGSISTVYYADENHSLESKKSKEDMYKSANLFFYKCLFEQIDFSDTGKE